MTPSLIILLDEYCQLQPNALLRDYSGEVPIAYLCNIPALKRYKAQLNDAVIIDIQLMSEKAARYERIRRMAPQSVVLVCADMTDIDMFQSMIAACSPLERILPPALLQHIALRKKQQGSTAAGSNGSHPAASYIKGTSTAMQELYETVSLVAPTSFNVVIYGETGTGKEALARQIHKASKRKEGPFVTLDCGCLNRETALSELFGHVKGAFTDALSDKTGAFELANGGTLFLDELANLPYDVQVSLLRAVQERTIRKLGASGEVKCDVRIIAATNEDLMEGSFRKDLYYRLNEVSLHLPPLRERGEDITLLAESFLDDVCRELNVSSKRFSACARNKLQEYPWPGNIRELKNVIKRTCLLSVSEEEITAARLILDDENGYRNSVPADMQDGLKDTVQKAEYDQIIATLKSVQFNKRKAAELLNIHRKTLYNKLKYMKAAFN